MTEQQRYPLSWPPGKARTADTSRKGGNFGTKNERTGGYTSISLPAALDRLDVELTRLGAHDPLLSTNLKVGLRGAPLADGPRPKDPGVCLYFTLGGKPHAMPCDTYATVESNIAALAAHIEATRAILRYGVGDLATVFRGFEALPSPGMARPWRVVMAFGVGQAVTAEMAESRFRQLAGERHPDRTGENGASMAELNRARADAKLELSPAAITG